ncbi:hypothetical protein Q3G72_006432 [Acer saccharum]|nr:hypothetical protein Q3G72_006432 [Acer saccharum]
MYAKRHRWAEALLRDRALARVRSNEAKDDFESRWRKNAKVVKSRDFSEAVPTEVTELVRFGSLMAQCSKLCYYASKSIAGYNEAKQAVCSLTRRMEELMTMDLQSHNTTLVSSKRGAVVNDPHIARTKGAQKSRKQCNATMTQGDRCMEIGHTNQTYEKTIPTPDVSAVSTNTPDVNCDFREYVPDRLPTIDKQCSVLVDFNVQVGGSMSCDSTVIAPTPQSFPFGVNSRVNPWDQWHRLHKEFAAARREVSCISSSGHIFQPKTVWHKCKKILGMSAPEDEILCFLPWNAGFRSLFFGFGKLNDIFRITRTLLAA